MLSSDLERLITMKRREIDQEKTLLGLTSVKNRDNSGNNAVEADKRVQFSSGASSVNNVLTTDNNNTNERPPVDDQDTISPDLERYIRRYLGLPVMLKAGEYSPNNPLLRTERSSGDVLLGLGEYERRRNTLRKIRQKQYREYLDQQAKKKQEAKEQAERERREREEKERLEEERERQRLELERERSPERRRSHSYSSYTTGANNTYSTKVDSAVQVDHRNAPLSVAVQTDDADLYVPTQRRNLLTQAERELSPHIVVEGKDNRSIQPGTWLRNPARTEYRDEERTGHRPDQTAKRDGNRTGDWRPDRDEIRTRDWRPNKTEDRDDKSIDWRRDYGEEGLIRTVDWSNQTGYREEDREQPLGDNNRNERTSDWAPDGTRRTNEIQDERSHKSERETKDWERDETSDRNRLRIKDIQDELCSRDEKRPGYCYSDETDINRPGYKRPNVSERDRRISEREQQTENKLDSYDHRSGNIGPEETANRKENLNGNWRPDRISERDANGQNEVKARDWPPWKDSQGLDSRWDDQKQERRRSYGDYERTWSQARKSPGPRYMPSILDAEAIQRRNQLAEQEAAERRQFYQQELRSQIREQQRIREERKTREKMLEQAEMRRLEQQLQTLQLAQRREDARARDATAAMKHNAIEYERKRTTLQKEIDLEQQLLRNPLRNVQTSKSDVPHRNKPYYPQYEEKRQTYSTNIPDGALFSPNYDVDSYLRKNLNPTKESLISNKMEMKSDVKHQELPEKKVIKCESSLPIPVLRHSPVNEELHLVKNYMNEEALSDAMQQVDDKWKVPIVQKNILKCMQGEDGRNVSILTQLGSIRRQLQMEQLKLDKMLLKNTEV